MAPIFRKIVTIAYTADKIRKLFLVRLGIQSFIKPDVLLHAMAPIFRKIATKTYTAEKIRKLF